MLSLLIVLGCGVGFVYLVNATSLGQPTKQGIVNVIAIAALVFGIAMLVLGYGPYWPHPSIRG